MSVLLHTVYECFPGYSAEQLSTGSKAKSIYTLPPGRTRVQARGVDGGDECGSEACVPQARSCQN